VVRGFAGRGHGSGVDGARQRRAQGFVSVGVFAEGL